MSDPVYVELSYEISFFKVNTKHFLKGCFGGVLFIFWDHPGLAAGPRRTLYLM